MKNTWKLHTAVLAAVVVSGVGIGAQSSSTDKNQPSTMTLTGCLQPAGGNGGTVGTSGRNPSSSEDFILANAKVGAAPGGGSAVTSVAPAGSGTNESAARAGSTKPSAALSGGVDKNGDVDKSASGTYALHSKLAEMPRHVGQEVEVSGHLVTSGTSSRSATGTSTPSTTTSASPNNAGATIGTAGMQQFEVQTIRMIASVCAAR